MMGGGEEEEEGRIMNKQEKVMGREVQEGEDNGQVRR